MSKEYELPFEIQSLNAYDNFSLSCERFIKSLNRSTEIPILLELIHNIPVYRTGENPKLTIMNIFRDEKCANIFEALVGTLRAAKKRKIIKFEGEMLLSPMHDHVDIFLL